MYKSSNLPLSIRLVLLLSNRTIRLGGAFVLSTVISWRIVYTTSDIARTLWTVAAVFFLIIYTIFTWWVTRRERIQLEVMEYTVELADFQERHMHDVEYGSEEWIRLMDVFAAQIENKHPSWIALVQREKDSILGGDV